MKTRISPAFPLIRRPKLVWRLPRGPFLRVVLALAIFGVPASGQGIISTVAGSGELGFPFESSRVTEAPFFLPFGVTGDSMGNVYISDDVATIIRQVDAEWLIRTIAGTGFRGFSGDGGPATSSRLGGPTAMTAGPAGSLYFADTSNHRIRKITPEGIITTVAGTGFRGYSGDGGLAAEAQLSRPAGIAFGPAGDLVFADMGNHVIRAILADSMLARKSWPDQKIQ